MYKIPRSGAPVERLDQDCAVALQGARAGLASYVYADRYRGGHTCVPKFAGARCVRATYTKIFTFLAHFPLFFTFLAKFSYF